MKQQTIQANSGGLIQKVVWVAKHRPNQFLKSARGYLLFEWSRLWRHFFIGSSGQIQLGKNVRLQRNFSLSAEKPNAKIRIGDHSIVYENAQVEAYAFGEIEIGASCILGDVRVYSREKVTLGNRVVTSWNVLIQDFDSHPVDPVLRGIQTETFCAQFSPSQLPQSRAESSKRLDWNFPAAAIEIGDDVWIGANGTILKGARIGNGSLIAAGAVVPRGDYPPRSLIAGNPARVVRQL